MYNICNDIVYVLCMCPCVFVCLCVVLEEAGDRIKDALTLAETEVKHLL